MALPENNLELYQVDLSELNKDNELNSILKESLANISNNIFDESYLRKLSTDGRNVVYVLADSSWTVHCALQVYLEGSIDGMPLENEEYGVSIHQSFKYFLQLPKCLCGVRIVHLFAHQDCNASTSIDILTNFYNGATIEYHFIREEGALVYLQKKWEKLHYLGVSRGIDMDPFFSWENLGFSLLFVGQLQPMFDYGLNCSVVFIKTLEIYELEVVSTNQECALSFLARFSLGIFVSLLARLRALPPTIAIRFINSFAELIPEQETVKKLWIPLDDQRVSDFIDHPHNYELVMHLVHDVAREYFLLQLPIELSDRERCVLLMMGLQQKVLREVADELEFDQPMVILSLRDVFQKSMDYFNQTPEVVDFKPNKKKRF